MQSAENRKFKFVKGVLTVTIQNTIIKDIQVIFQSNKREIVNKSIEVLNLENSSD